MEGSAPSKRGGQSGQSACLQTGADEQHAAAAEQQQRQQQQHARRLRWRHGRDAARHCEPVSKHSKQQHTRTPWYSWLPCEKLKRATFMPERSISHSVGTLRGGGGWGAGRGRSEQIHRASKGGWAAKQQACTWCSSTSGNNEERGTRQQARQQHKPASAAAASPAGQPASRSNSNSLAAGGAQGADNLQREEERRGSAGEH